MRDVQIYLTQVHADISADADRGAFPLTLEETQHYQVTRGILEAQERY